MTGLDWLIATYGLASIIAVGRALQSAANRKKVWRAAFWCATALGMGLWIEFATPLAATFSNVMIRFIEVWARVF